MFQGWCSLDVEVVIAVDDDGIEDVDVGMEAQGMEAQTGTSRLITGAVEAAGVVDGAGAVFVAPG